MFKGAFLSPYTTLSLRVSCQGVQGLACISRLQTPISYILAQSVLSERGQVRENTGPLGSGHLWCRHFLASLCEGWPISALQELAPSQRLAHSPLPIL